MRNWLMLQTDPIVITQDILESSTDEDIFSEEEDEWENEMLDETCNSDWG